MLERVFRSLDEWVAGENGTALDDGRPLHPTSTIRVFGQIALWEARVPFGLAITQDVDVFADYTWAVEKRFERLLAAEGKVLDPLGAEAWMPKETVYQPIYEGTYVIGKVAEADFVLISKALKAPAKNSPLMTEVLARGPSQRFFELATRYGVDLEQFL